jgi:serine-type D-Ala-D-Ala endopeptidase (penicillin-binding protein 7)
VTRFSSWRAPIVAALVTFLAAAGADAAHKKRAKRQAGKARQKAVLVERRVPALKSGMPNVQALGALVMDETGQLVFARNPDKPRPIASISKLMATLAVMDRGLELEGLTTIARSDVEIARGGARSRLLEGMTLSNRDLLHAALMASDNRAIPALGRAVKLTAPQLTAAMNAKAKELGFRNTQFLEPTGLSPGNVSTPRETIGMLKAVVAHPILGPISRRGEYDAHPVGKPPIRYYNTDRPAERRNVQLVGGKTGYNDIARYCLVVGTRIDDRLYYMAFLGNEGKMTRFGDVARVADWVVTHKPKTAIATGGSAPLPVGVAAPPPEPAPTASATP